MLVTCLKCKKPVFVSSAALGVDEASVPCNACHASLLVSESGSVRLAEEGRRAPPTPTDDPPADRSAFPVQKPRVGIGSFGENESLTVGGGEWIPQRPDDQPASAPPPIPEDADAAPPVPPPIPEDADAAPPVPPPIPENADAASPVPPPIPEDTDAAPPVRARAGTEEEPGEPARTDPPLPPVPVSEAREQAAPEPAAQQAGSAASSTAPVDAEALAEHVETREPIAPALDATQPLATPEPAAPGPVATRDAVEAPESSATPEHESPVDVRPSHGGASADEPPAVRAAVESWTVASSPFHGPVEEITRDVDVSGRAGTVPLDEQTFRREVSHSRVRYVAAAAVILVAASCLWAAGVVSVPGLPAPFGLEGLFDPGDQPVAPAPDPAPAVAIEAPLQPATPAPEPPEPDRPAPTAVEPPESDAREQAAVTEGEPAEAEDVAGRRRGKRRRRGASGPRHRGEDEAGESAVAAAAVDAGTPSPPDPPAAAPPVAELAAAPAAVLHYKQGNLFLREKKVALAIDELKKAVAINPSYGVAYRSLGVAYMLLGREKSAVKSYERFVATEPSHRDVAKVREIIADYYRRNPR